MGWPAVFPWVTVAWRTHQSNPKKKTHMLTCTSSYFWFYVPTTQETINLKPQIRWARQTLTMWLCYNSLSHVPNHYRAEPVSRDQCPKWSLVLNPKYQTCLNFRNPDGINRQWKPADQKTSPTSCWRIWLDICLLPCLQTSRVINCSRTDSSSDSWNLLLTFVFVGTKAPPCCCRNQRGSTFPAGKTEKIVKTPFLRTCPNQSALN